MSRIDVKTLVLAFEKRISELEKNPPDKISTGVVVNLLEKAIEEEIKNHFKDMVKSELIERIRNEYSLMHESFITKCLEDILIDDDFRGTIAESIKRRMLRGIE